MSSDPRRFVTSDEDNGGITFRKPAKAFDVVTDAREFLAALRGARQEIKAGRRMSVAAVNRVVNSFDWKSWNAEMLDALHGPLQEIVHEQARTRAKQFSVEFNEHDPFVQKHFTAHVGSMIKSIDGTTRDEVATLIRNVLADDDGAGSVNELGDKIGDLVKEKFAGYADWRADTIARTETANVYNLGDLFGYHQAGIAEVDVLDSDDDEECAAANGQRWSLSYALAHLTAHPNCVRSFTAVEPDRE